jgi:Rrf2 family transcriptional regulator, iron-sulfur cluster assembly transcription factor
VIRFIKHLGNIKLEIIPENNFAQIKVDYFSWFLTMAPYINSIIPKNYMILTTKGRYAVMAMIEIADEKTNRPVSLSVIAERQDISLSYLEQLFTKLKKAGIVKSIKGPGGGYILGKSSKEINVAEIIKATGETIKMTRCNNKKDGCISTKKTRCKTHHLWHGLEKNIYNYLSAISLQDICNDNIEIFSFLNTKNNNKILAG